MSTAADNFLRRHLPMPWSDRPATAEAATATPPPSRAADLAPAGPPSVSFTGFGLSGNHASTGSLTRPAQPDPSALDLDLSLDLALDLVAGPAAGTAQPAPAPAALFTPMAPSAAEAPRAVRVDLDLPLETVPAILWRSDPMPLGGTEPGAGAADAPLATTAAEAVDAAVSAVASQPPAKHATGTGTAPAAPDQPAGHGTAPRWHGGLDTTLAKAWAQSQLVALLRIGTDRLGDVATALGAAGVAAVQEAFSHRLDALLNDPGLRPTTEGARLQPLPDGYLIILPGLRSASLAESLARRCLEVLARPVAVGEHRLALQGAVGISVFPHDGQQTAGLLRSAEVAWRHASQRGRSGYQFYAQEMERRSLRRLTLEADLRCALTENAVALQFRPRAAVRNGTLNGAEVQLAWTPPGGTPMGTAELLTLASDVGLGDRLAHWLVGNACVQLIEWARAGLGCERLTLPVLPSALRRDYSVQRLHEILYDHGIGPGQIVLMLTPALGDCIGQSPASAPGPQQQQDARDWALRLAPLRDAGFGLAIDGAATSAHALAALRHLPLSEFRVDAQVLDSLDDEAGSLTRSVIAMGRRLKLRVVASGVDSTTQFERLRQLGADDVQGDLLSEPLDARTWRDVLMGARHLPTSSLMSVPADFPLVTPPAALPVDALPELPELSALSVMTAALTASLPLTPAQPARTDATTRSGCDISLHLPTHDVA